MFLKYCLLSFSFILACILLPNPLSADCTRDQMCDHFETRYAGTPVAACNAGLACADNDARKELCRHFFYQAKAVHGADISNAQCKTVPVPEVIDKGDHRPRRSNVYLITSKYGDDLLTDVQISTAWAAIREFTFPMSMCHAALGARKDRLIANEQNELETLVAADIRLFAIPKTLYELLLLSDPRFFSQPPHHDAAQVNGAPKPNGRLFEPSIRSPNDVCENWATDNFFKTKLIHQDTTNLIVAANKAIVPKLIKVMNGSLKGEGNIDRLKTAARNAIASVTVPARASDRSLFQKEFRNLKDGISRRHAELIDMIGQEYAESVRTGFMIFRGVKNSEMKRESEFFGGKAEQSWAASLFGGWYFDGPSIVGNNASTISYLIRNVSVVLIYMRVSLRSFLNKTLTEKSPYHRVWVPPTPIILQMTGYGGTFHPRGKKRSWDDVEGAANKKRIALEYFKSTVRYYTPNKGIWTGTLGNAAGTNVKYGE